MALSDFAGWDWGAIGKAVLGAGIGTALVQGILSWYRDRRDRQVHAAYLALRVAVALETFAGLCLDLTGNKEVAESSGDAVGDFTTKLPDIPQYPADDSGWRSLEPVLSEKALTFPGKVASAQRGVSFLVDVADMHAGFDACFEASARLGLESYELASELRRAYRFPPFRLRGTDRLREIVRELPPRDA